MSRDSDSGFPFWLVLLGGYLLFSGDSDDKAPEAAKVDNKPKVVQTAAVVEEPKMSPPPAEVPLKTAEELFEGTFEAGAEDPFKDTFDADLFD